MINHEQILKRFMRKFIRFPFAGPLRRKVPAIFRQPLKLEFRTIASRASFISDSGIQSGKPIEMLCLSNASRSRSGSHQTGPGSFWKNVPCAPHFPDLRSGHRFFPRPSPQPHLQIRHCGPDVPCCPGRDHPGGGLGADHRLATNAARTSFSGGWSRTAPPFPSTPVLS